MKKYNRFFIIIVSMLVVSLLIACKGKGNNDSSSANQETEMSLMTTASAAATEPTVSQETETTKATTASVTEAPTTEYVTTTESTPKKIIADDYWDGNVFDVIGYCLDKGYKVTARNGDLEKVDYDDKSTACYYIHINEEWGICIYAPLFINVYSKENDSYDVDVFTMYYEEGWKLVSVESDECYVSKLKSCKMQIEQFLLIENNILSNNDPLEGIDEKFLDIV